MPLSNSLFLLSTFGNLTMTFPCRVFFELSRLGIFDLQTPGARQSAPAPVKTVRPLARKAVGVEGHDEGCRVSYPSPCPPRGRPCRGHPPRSRAAPAGEGVGPVERSLCSLRSSGHLRLLQGALALSRSCSLQREAVCPGFCGLCWCGGGGVGGRVSDGSAPPAAAVTSLKSS